MYKLKCEAFSTFSSTTSTRTGKRGNGCESGSAPHSTGMEKRPRDTRDLQPCVIREEHKWSVDYEGSGAGGSLGNDSVSYRIVRDGSQKKMSFADEGLLQGDH